MKITALDIRQKTFEKAFRGVDKDEVQAFLVTLSQQWERMGDENRELRLKLEHATHDVQKMREVETSLYRTLKTAEDTGNSITEQSQRDADLRIREAQLKADQILSEARQEARRLVEEATREAEKSVAAMRTEVNSLGQECHRLETQMENLVRDLQHLASDALEKVAKAKARPKTDAAAILSRAESVQVNKPEPSPKNDPAMRVTSASTSSAAAVAGASSAALGGSLAAEPRSIGPQPGSYNPKPGQQPDPGAPAQTPGPEIRPGSPDENPGKADPSRIYQPEPSRVPEPGAPNIEPTAPDIQPIGPGHPEIMPPSPATHPGMATAASAEKSFFDEI
jgi:cell division initiation protein